MKNRISVLAAALIVPSFAFLGGCGGGQDFQDLEAKVAEIKARPRGRIEPPPEFKPIATFSYSAHQLRSPFNPPVKEEPLDVVEGKQVEPDFTRPKEYLERFSLDSLKMVGTMQKPGKALRAIIKDPEGNSNLIDVGTHMGKNFGRVIGISESKVTLIEIVPDGHDGWVERPRSIRLAD